MLTFRQGWFIFTTMLLICTLKSTVAFFLLFFTLDMAFLLLGIGYLRQSGKGSCITAGGAFALAAAFLAWYNALAGIADTSNRYVAPVPWFTWSHYMRQAALSSPKSGVLTRSWTKADCNLFYSFFIIPVAHFPWSEKGKQVRGKQNEIDKQA